MRCGRSTVPEIVEIQKLFVASARRLVAGRLRRRRDPRGQRLSLPAVLHAAHQQAHRPLRRLVRQSRALAARDDRPREETRCRDFPLDRAAVARASSPKAATRRRRSSSSRAGSKRRASRRSTSPAAATKARSFPSTASSRRRFRAACLAPYSKPIKEAVSIPVFVAGRLVDPEDAEAVLASGCADFVSVGPRAVCRSALVPESVRRGRRRRSASASRATCASSA